MHRALPLLLLAQWHVGEVDRRALLADPDSPSIQLGLRWIGLSAKVGGVVPLVGRREDTAGFNFRLTGFVELHNTSATPFFVPYENWRGHFAAEGLYHAPWRTELLRDVYFSLAAEHESDHPTGTGRGEAGFVFLNALAVRSGASLSWPGHSLSAVLTVRAHVFTCTFRPSTCAPPGGFIGGQTAEARLDLVHDVPFGEPHAEAWRWVTALHGAWLFGHGDIATERRVALATGVAKRAIGKGLFTLRAEVRAGSAVGYLRMFDQTLVGITAGWAP